MAKCKECKSYFPLDDKASKGDCVRRESDAKQMYHTAKPTDANGACEYFTKK